MKKIVLILMFALVASVTSYAQQDNSVNNRSVNFHLVTDGAATRTSGTYRYVLEVYPGTDVSGARLYHFENNTGNFTNVTLEKTENYMCLFWADSGTVDNNTTDTYDASDLKLVHLNAGEDAEEAFFAKKAIILTTPTANTISLKRAVAKVNLIEEGTVTANTNLVVTFDHYPSFNTFTSAAAGTTASTSKTFNSSATTGILGTFLTFASIGVVTDNTVDSGGTATTFTFVFGGVTNTQTTTLVANYPTNIYGNFDQ